MLPAQPLKHTLSPPWSNLPHFIPEVPKSFLTFFLILFLSLPVSQHSRVNFLKTLISLHCYPSPNLLIAPHHTRKEIQVGHHGLPGPAWSGPLLSSPTCPFLTPLWPYFLADLRTRQTFTHTRAFGTCFLHTHPLCPCPRTLFSQIFVCLTLIPDLCANCHFPRCLP